MSNQIEYTRQEELKKPNEETKSNNYKIIEAKLEDGKKM